MVTEEYSREAGSRVPRTYRITLGRKIFVVLTSIPIAIFIAGILLSLGLKGPGSNPFDLVLILIVVAGNCLIFIPRFVGALWTSVTIDGRTIVRRTMWWSRELNIDDVRGFEVNRVSNAIFLETDRPGQKRIILSVHLEEFAEIAEWVQEEFRNLSAERYRSELSNIFYSNRYGADKRSRREKFQIAILRARSINVVAIAVSLWAFIHPEPYMAAIVASALLPIVAIWALVSSGGLILLDASSWRVSPTVDQAFLMPALVLFFRAYNDYSLISFSPLWLPLAAGIVVLGVVFFFGVRDFRDERHVRIPTIIFTVIFVYGVLIEANCLFDPHPPQIVPAAVTSKKINSIIFAERYQVGFTPWRDGGPSSDEHVTREVYEAIEVGEKACVELHDGLLGIPWYNVTWCKK